jgi:hypothetical protein
MVHGWPGATDAISAGPGGVPRHGRPESVPTGHPKLGRADGSYCDAEIDRWPSSCTVSLYPAGTRVVDCSSSMTAGPVMAFPASRAPRSHTDAEARLRPGKATGRCPFRASAGGVDVPLARVGSPGLPS